MNNNRRNDLDNEICIAEMYVKGMSDILTKKPSDTTTTFSKISYREYIAVRKSMTAAKLKVLQNIAETLLKGVVKDFMEVYKCYKMENAQTTYLYYYRVLKKLGVSGIYYLLIDNLALKMSKYDWICKSYRDKHTKKIQVLYFNPDKNDVIKKHLFWYENPKNMRYSGLNIEEKMIKIFGPKSQQSVNYEYVPKGKLFTIVDDRDIRFNEVLFKTLVRPELRDKLRTHPDFTEKFAGRCIMMRDEVDNPITDLHWLRDVFDYDNYL